MTALLATGGVIRTRGGARDWMLVEDGYVRASGRRGSEPAATVTLDLDGATVTPSFCDAHVHLPATGLLATGLDLRGEHRADNLLARLHDRASTREGPLYGANFEDPLDRPIDRTDLDRAVGARPALVARADLHSCVVSTALLEQLDADGLVGVDVDSRGRPTGYLRERAAALAWTWFDRSLTPAEQRHAVRAAAEAALSRGVTEVHEMFVVEWRGWASLQLFLETAAELTLDVLTYAADTDVDRIAGMGLPRIGGDLFLDGSFGSHTAWMHTPFTEPTPAGSPPCGISYRSDGELLELCSNAQRRRLQVGVHAIGDAAIEQAIGAWEEVARREGRDAVRSLAHRIEHFECSSDDHLRRAAALGLGASIQPAFDRLWGGSGGLYERRIGPERAGSMNRFASMLAAGMAVGAGSDSTVTPLDPFLQMASLRTHHVEAESLDAQSALDLHTWGSRVLARPRPSAGTLEPGLRADFCVLDRDPVEVDPDEVLKTEVLATYMGGRRVWPMEHE